MSTSLFAISAYNSRTMVLILFPLFQQFSLVFDILNGGRDEAFTVERFAYSAPNFNTSLFGFIAKNWTAIEKIIDFSCLDLSTRLLEAVTCNKLTSIDISFMQRYRFYNIKNEEVKSLIVNIHNAPALENIVLRNVPIRLVDMENIHRGGRNLKIVKLDHAYIYSEDTNALTDSDAARNIKSF